MHLAIIFLTTLIVCLCIDVIWLTLIAKSFYINAIGHLMQKNADGTISANYASALVVYALIAAGVMLFVLPKAQGNYVQAGCYGALFGFIVYGIYDFTNLATLANWPLSISLIDMAWGGFLCGITSLFATWMTAMMK